MVAAVFLPLLEQVSEEPVDGLFEVQVPVDVKVPHLAAHLDEEVDHRGRGPEDYL